MGGVLGVFGSFGERAVAIGTSSTATGTDNIGIGTNVDVGGIRAIVIGREAESISVLPNISTDTITIGTDSTTHGDNTIAFGHNANASHDNSAAIGFNATTTDTDQIVLGDSNTTTTPVSYTHLTLPTILLV